MLAVSRTFSLIGVEAEPVHVELDLHRGLPAFTIVGLPDAAVRESRERVRAALVNSGFEFPLRRITANLAPANMRKAGPGFDLAIAAALLFAGGQLSGPALERYAFAGELALDGSIRKVPGALAMAEAARNWGMRGIVVAPEDAAHAAMVEGVEVVALDHLGRITELASGSLRTRVEVPPAPAPVRADLPDIADLRGQPMLRRALEIAAAGGHSMLLTGPPGAGKTMAARRLPSLLPPLDGEERLEVSRIAGILGQADPTRPVERPFRAPHHTCSVAALVGGGVPPRPGEATRAHGGVLFLDELGEFRRDVLEAMRQPLEEGRVVVSRAGRSVRLPCRFMLVAASNPCPCGRGEESGSCDCNPVASARYRAKLSGALADRIDIFLPIGRPGAEALAGKPGECSESVRERVIGARLLQRGRLGPGRCNSWMTGAEMDRWCVLGEAGKTMMVDGHRTLGLSGRGWDRVIRVARTIADLDAQPRIRAAHLAEALSLRRGVAR